MNCVDNKGGGGKGMLSLVEWGWDGEVLSFNSFYTITDFGRNLLNQSEFQLLDKCILDSLAR